METIIEEIKRDFAKVIEYSQGIENPKLDQLFKDWYEAKKDFIHAFGGKLICELPEEVHFELGESEKKYRAEEFIHLIESRWENYKLAKFLEDNWDGFFKNEVVTPCELPGGKKIPKGMKLVKAFKYFEEDKTALTDIQNYASRIIQENKVVGHLCFSVHPLDFLSSSENDYNWRSCHSLDGEYRAGNLSYMVDKSTIICYLKSENNVKLPNFPEDVPWTNKKWRMLLFFSNDMSMMFAGRQYPFTTVTGPDIVRQNLHNVGLFKDWSEWNSVKVTRVTDDNGTVFHLKTTYVPVGGVLRPIDEVIKNGEHGMHFNDLLNSSCYSPIYSFNSRGLLWTGSEGRSRPNTHFVIGGPVYCMDCGQYEITISETMRCVSCEEAHGDLNTDDFGYCSCCGRHVYFDNVTWVGDDPVCDHCLSSQASTCSDCEEWFYNDDLIYDRETGGNYCHRCYNRLEREE